MYEKFKMYNPLTGAVVYTTEQFVQKWNELGFILIPNNIIPFPIKGVA